jgi:hypothetical protein
MPWDNNGNWYPGPGDAGPPMAPGETAQEQADLRTARANGSITGQGAYEGYDVGLASNRATPDDPAFQWGGHAAGAQQDVARMQAMQQWAEGRAAPQLDQQAYGLARGAMQGNAPSAATTQMGMGVGQGMGSELAAMNATSGGRFNTKAGMMGGVTGAAGEGAQMQNQAIGQGVAGRAQEIGTARGQFAGMAGQNLQAQQQQAAYNDELMQKYLRGEMDINTAQQKAWENARGMANQIGMSQEQYQFHPGPAVLGGISGASSGIMGGVTGGGS